MCRNFFSIYILNVLWHLVQFITFHGCSAFFFFKKRTNLVVESRPIATGCIEISLRNYFRFLMLTPSMPKHITLYVHVRNAAVNVSHGIQGNIQALWQTFSDLNRINENHYFGMHFPTLPTKGCDFWVEKFTKNIIIRLWEKIKWWTFSFSSLFMRFIVVLISENRSSTINGH